MMKKILIIEDDQEINKLLQVIIKKLGASSVSAYSGTEGILQLKQQAFDLVLLDMMLPGMAGPEVLAQIRTDSTVPVIVISAKDGMTTKVQMLKAGAEDYITKPFDQEEVAARIEVQLRKVPTIVTNDSQTHRGIKLDHAKRLAYLEGEPLTLTNAEFDVLSYLMLNPERALSKKEIYEKVWRGTYVGDDNTISVHVSNIRKKFAKVTADEYIKTIWGIGFMLS